MAEEYIIVKRSDLETIADSVRNVTAQTDPLTLAQINDSILNISSGHMLKGVAETDNDGILTFPPLNFTPNVILVWNVEEQDYGDDTWDPDDGYVRYTIEGTMLMAIRENGKWVSQCMTDSSGEVYITNASATGGTGEFLPEASSSGILENGNIYSYQVGRYPTGHEYVDHVGDFSQLEFNYVIYE